MTEAGLIEDHSWKFSPSKLSTYKECPRKYKFRYIDGLKRTGQTVEQFLGTCVHSSFEALYENLQKGRLMSEEAVLGVFEEAWDKDVAGVVPQPDDTEAWKSVGRQCVTNYYREFRPFTNDTTNAVERRIGFDLVLDGQKYRVEGFIDRLASGKDGAFEIHDYKTAKNLPNQAHVDEDWQLAIYELALRSEWPKFDGPVRLIWHYVRHGRSLVSTRTKEQLAALEAEVRGVIRAIKADHDFKPVESNLCGWCEYKPLCPLFAHGVELEKLTPELRSSDEGRQAVDSLEALDQKKRALRADIRALEAEQESLEERLLRYAKERGLAAVSGTHVDAVLTEKESWKWPTKTHGEEKLLALEAELKETPLWKDASHFDGARLLERMKGWPADWKKIAESVLGRYAQRVAETALKLRKRRDDAD